MKLANKTLVRVGCSVVLIVGSAGVLGGGNGDIHLIVTPKAMADAPLQKTVRYGDLNLSNPSGVAVLHRRLEGAVQYVCNPYSGNVPKVVGLKRKCMAESMQAAVVQINHPNLTAFHRAKSGSKPILTAKADLRSR